MHVALPESESPVKLVLDPEHPLTDDQYFAFCMANSNLRIERTAQGEIVIAPPAGGESDHRSVEVSSQLHDWARKDGRDAAFGSSTASRSAGSSTAMRRPFTSTGSASRWKS